MEATSNFKHFEKKKMIVIANVYPILQTVKDLVWPLSKKRCLRISFDSQQVRKSKTLVKSTWEHLYHIFLSLWGEIIWKISPSVKFEILEVPWSSSFKDHYLKNKKLFPSFFFDFLKFQPILKVLKKSMIDIANVLPILQTVKDLVRPLSKKRRQNILGSSTC